MGKSRPAGHFGFRPFEKVLRQLYSHAVLKSWRPPCRMRISPTDCCSDLIEVENDADTLRLIIRTYIDREGGQATSPLICTSLAQNPCCTFIVLAHQGFKLATPPGFEPGLNGPKPLVLPLHHGVVRRGIKYHQAESIAKDLVSKIVFFVVNFANPVYIIVVNGDLIICNQLWGIRKNASDPSENRRI